MIKSDPAATLPWHGTPETREIPQIILIIINRCIDSTTISIFFSSNLFIFFRSFCLSCFVVFSNCLFRRIINKLKVLTVEV